MMLLLSLLFCFDARIWQKAKVNYSFVFEFDTRHHIDWRQLSEVSIQCLRNPLDSLADNRRYLLFLHLLSALSCG